MLLESPIESMKEDNGTSGFLSEKLLQRTILVRIDFFNSSCCINTSNDTEPGVVWSGTNTLTILPSSRLEKLEL